MRDASGQSLELFAGRRRPPLRRRSASRRLRSAGSGSTSRGSTRLAAGPPSLPPFAVAVGRGEPPSTDTWVTTAVLVAAIGAGLSILGLVVIGLLRRRSRARAAREAEGVAPAAIAGGAAEETWARPSGDVSSGEPAMPLAPPAGLPPLPAGDPFAVGPAATGLASAELPPLPSGAPAGAESAGGGLPIPTSTGPAAVEPLGAGLPIPPGAEPGGAGPVGAGPALPPLPSEAGLVAVAAPHAPSRPDRCVWRRDAATTVGEPDARRLAGGPAGSHGGRFGCRGPACTAWR